MKRIITLLILLASVPSYATLSIIATNVPADNLGGWAYKINETILQVNTNTTDIAANVGGISVLEGKTNSWDAVSTNTARIVVLEGQTNLINGAAQTSDLPSFSAIARRVSPPTNNLAQWLTSPGTSNIIASIGDNADLSNISCIELNGSSSYIAYTYTNDLVYPVRLSAWFKTTATAIGTIAGFFNTADSVEYLRLTMLADGTLRADRSSSGASDVSGASTNAWNDGEWHEAVLYFEDATTLTVTVDGAVDLSETGATSVTGITPNNFSVGRLNRPSPSQYFDGPIGRVTGDNGDEIDVIIMWGQSQLRRASGIAGYSAYTNQWHYYSYDVDQINSGNPVTNAALDYIDADYWGPELSFGYEITQNTGKRVAIVKVATGGTSVFGTWLPPSGAQYVELVNLLNAAISDLQGSGYDPVIREVISALGEEDSKTYSNATNYFNGWNAVVDNLASDCGFTRTNVHFTISQTAPTFPNGDYVSEVREQQQLIADTYDNVDIVDGAVISIGGDNVHYDSAGQITHGELLYSKYRGGNPYNIVLTFEESTGTSVYNAAIYNSTATSTACTWTNSTGLPSWLHQYGFVTDSGAYIPARLETGRAANGAALDGPAGFVHNGSPASIDLYSFTLTSGTWPLTFSQLSSKTNSSDLVRSVLNDSGMIVEILVYTNMTSEIEPEVDFYTSFR